MNYLERYINGEYEHVWSELQALGPAVRKEPHYSLAREVAAETMRRVRRNCEMIVSRLRALGYVFGVYPDGSRGYYTRGPLVPPSGETRADCASLEEQVGPLPISLVAFWQEVGSVDLVGMRSSCPTCGLRSSAGVACRAWMARHLGSNHSMFWLRVLNRSEGWGGSLDGAFGRRSDMT